MATLGYYIWICLVTAFICAGVREEAPARLARATLRLFVTIAGGIALFGVAVHLLCLAVLP